MVNSTNNNPLKLITLLFRYEEYLNAESRVNRKACQPDSRVHCCLYFVTPSGHGLKPLDVEFMQRLHEKVNIIPVIAKADTMTPDECSHFKKQVRTSFFVLYEYFDLKFTVSDVGSDMS